MYNSDEVLFAQIVFNSKDQLVADKSFYPAINAETETMVWIDGSLVCILEAYGKRLVEDDLIRVAHSIVEKIIYEWPDKFFPEYDDWQDIFKRHHLPEVDEEDENDTEIERVSDYVQQLLTQNKITRRWDG